MNPRIYIITILVLGFIGFADATYLTATHFMDAPPGCGEEGGCGEVTSSEYSTLFGIPISLFGIMFYLSMIFMSLLWLDRKPDFVALVLPIFSAPAFLFSMWLVYLMLFVLEAICWYCMGSAASSTLIFITSFLFWKSQQ
ncbi:MAG: vitamin K epoxide reductase family protein [Balneolales bacterium]|nr:vitamin K epoxide reductase family protein [Balneolales bacterium]